MVKRTKAELLKEIASLKHENARLKALFSGDDSAIIEAPSKEILSKQFPESQRDFVKSEAFFKKIFESSPTGIIVEDKNGNILEVNDAFCKSLGYNSEELIGKNIRMFVHQEDFSHIDKNINELLKGKHLQHIEKSLRKDGSIAYIQLNEESINLSKSEKGILCMTEDISEKVAMENILKESEQRYKDLFSNSPFPTLVHSEGKIIALNKAALEFSELNDMKKLIGKPIIDFVHKDFRESALQRMKKSISENRSQNIIEEKFITGKGNIRDVEIGTVPIQINRKTAIQVVFRDITIRKAMELSLKDSETRYRSLYEGSPVPILIHSNGKILSANKAAVKFAEVKDPYDLIGKPVWDFIHPDSHKLIKNRYRKIAGNENVLSPEKEVLLTAKKNRRIAEVSTMAFRLGGELIFQVVLNDITAKEEAVEKLKKSLESYRGLFDNAIDAIYIQDFEGRFVDVNDSVLKMYGYPKEFYIGKTPIALSAPGKNDMKMVLDCFEKAKKGIPQQFNFWGQRKDGSIFPKIVRVNRGTYFGEDVVFAFATDISAIKEVEKALKFSEQKYRQLVDNSLTGTYIIQDDILKFCNKKFAEIYGYDSPEQMIGLKTKHLIAPQGLGRSKEEIKRREGNENEISQYDSKIINRNGDYIDVEILGTSIIFEGKPAAQGNLIDVTSKKRAEEALQASEERYRKLFNFLPYGGEVLDLDGYIEDCSSSSAEMLGYKTSDLIGHHISEFLYKDGIDFYKTKFSQIIQGEIVNNEIGMIHKNGEILRVLRAAQPIMDPKTKKVTHVLALNVDITERVKIADELSRLATVIRQAGEIVVITDLLGQAVYVNPAFEQISGYSLDEVKEQNLFVFKSAAMEEDEHKKIWESINKGEKWHGIFKNFRKDGTFYIEKAEIFPIKNSDNEIINFAKVAMDITEEQKLQERLQQSQKMEAIGTLSGGVAHDFNNLLTIIMGRAEMAMQNDQLENNTKNDLRSILSAGERAGKLVSHLLAFSRKQIYAPHIVNINQVVEDLEKMLRRLIPEDIQIKTKLNQEIPNIKADPHQLEQILMNLVVNAKDAIADKKAGYTERLISIRTSSAVIDGEFSSQFPEANPGIYVVIEVEDTGKGISADIKDRIFEPFFTTKEVGKGTGLGLSMIYGIVKQNEGFIRLESGAEEGTTFFIYWPYSKGSLNNKEQEKVISDLYRGNERVLLVEDDPEVRNFSQRVLEDKGYKVFLATNGKEALHMVNLSREKFDLLITDIIMPEMNGKDLAFNVKDNIAPDRVLFISGYSYDTLLKENAMEEEINFLQKPYSINEFLKRVRHILDSAKPIQTTVKE